MSKPRGKRTTLPVERELFDEFFVIDTDGYTFALDALATGKIRTPYEAIEMVCCANRELTAMFVEQMAGELQPFGKTDAWLAALDAEDYERSDGIIISCISRKRIDEVTLGTRKQLRAELGIPDLGPEGRLSARAPRRHPGDGDDDGEEWKWPGEEPALPEGAEAATVPIAPWRFERYFDLHGPGHWITLDAFRESVIATPYETVEMICNVNLMHTLRFRQLMAQALLEQFATEEELIDAMENGTFKQVMFERMKTDWFHQKSDALMLEIRKRFGVPEPETRGRAEKYRLWSETRLKPVN